MKTYRAGQPPEDPAALPGFLRSELASVEQAAVQAEPYVRLQVLYAQPTKMFPAMLVYADGTTWNPGSGEGLYRRNAANTAWSHLSTWGLSGSATYDPANLVDGAGVTTTVTVTGAALGDFAIASFSLDLQGIDLTAWVSAANTVSVRFQNETGGALDLGSGTLRARVSEA